MIRKKHHDVFFTPNILKNRYRRLLFSNQQQRNQPGLTPFQQQLSTALFNDGTTQHEDIKYTLINDTNDSEGLKRAYDNDDKIYSTHAKMFIAGTNVFPQDYWDDLKIPFKLTKYSRRYRDADKLLQQKPEVKDLIGHSLGGTVSLELEKNHPDRHYDTTTYGAPVLSTTPGNRYRHHFDPISMFDLGATTIGTELNPHTYTGFESYSDNNNFSNKT